jgi:probable rRNA maturation factor
MPARSKSISKGRRSVPKFLVHVSRSEGASKRPSAAKIRAAFSSAWNLIPATRFPSAFEKTRVSADIHFANDAEIAELNARHMKHEGPTDVLSFPMGDDDRERRSFHLGDIVASFETAEREARARSISVEEELLRYCLHGFLHCMGYDDSTRAKQKAIFAVQEEALSLTMRK